MCGALSVCSESSCSPSSRETLCPTFCLHKHCTLVHSSIRDWLLKTHNFLPSTMSHSLSGFVFSLSLWLDDGRLATWTTKQQTALLSIQEWFDPRDFRQDACQRVCVCVCVWLCGSVLWAASHCASHLRCFASGFMLICGSHFVQYKEPKMEYNAQNGT